jgi:transposase InsO family protein
MISRLRFISTERAAYGVKRLCVLLGVARSAFYRWLNGEQARAARAAEDERIVAKIRRAYEASTGTYGSPRITVDLREAGEVINRKRVARLMREHGIVGLVLRRAKRTTIPDRAAPSVPDLVKQDFSVGPINARWCGDITYLPVGGSWLYLATVIDMGSRRLIGWSIADHMRTDLIIDALQAAVRARGGHIDGVIFHSDRGSQYTSAEFAKVCARYGIRRSMGKVGTSYDNALAESLFASLKRETLRRLPLRQWISPAQARTDVFRWIAWYNHRRRHSSLNNLAPAVYEDQPATVTELAA